MRKSQGLSLKAGSDDPGGGLIGSSFVQNAFVECAVSQEWSNRIDTAPRIEVSQCAMRTLCPDQQKMNM